MAQCIQCKTKGMFLKLTDSGLCIICAANKIKELDAILTPEARSAIDMGKLCKEKEQTLQDLENKIAQAISNYSQLSQEYQAKTKDLLVLNDELEMESFSLYRPKYAFSNSDGYKEKLEDIREQQKQMIKEKSAAICDTEWSVEGSKAKGRAFANEMIKLFLRSFNNECDMAIQTVKFSNYDRCRERINKSYTTINGLGRTNTVHISPRYKELKLEELLLAYEYQRKKQEEKEALQELRAQQREEAKLAKEIEAARKEAEKERKHYMQALEKLGVQLSSAAEKDRAALIEKQNELMGFLDDINAKMEDIDYRQSNQRAGYVYIISNIGSFGEGVYKIGMTRRLDPMERVYELGDASVPFRFDVHAMIFSDDAPKLEAALHNAFASKRVNAVNTRREYFRVSLDEIKDVVRRNHDKTVEFYDVAEAQQYRESCKMIGM